MRTSLILAFLLVLAPTALRAAYSSRPYGYGSNLGNYGAYGGNTRSSSSGSKAAFQRTPALSGSTGIVDLPSAYMQASMASWAEDGRVVNYLNVATQGYEMGVKISEGNWAKHFKYLLTPEVKSKKYMLPAIAAGILDSGSSFDPRKYFVVASSYLTEADAYLHWGLTRAQGEGTAPYWGIEFPLTTSFYVRGEYDCRGDVWNVGLEYTLSNAITAFRYLRDYRDKHPESTKDGDITGLCYRKSF